MDTTEKYIKMCEKAEEIQKLRKKRSRYKGWEVGDFFSSDKYIDVFHICDEAFFFPPKKSIWLSRQDQLQSMILNNSHPYNLAAAFGRWIQGIWGDEVNLEEIGYAQSFDSLEQLWLAFVMQEKYEKVWDDKNEKWTTPSNKKIP